MAAMVVVSIGVYTCGRITALGHARGACTLAHLTYKTVAHVAGIVAFSAVLVACIRIYAISIAQYTGAGPNT
jgi:hypothetical protein